MLGKLPPTNPGYEDANAITETVGDKVFRSAHDFAKIVPTTLAGAVALLEYIHFFIKAACPNPITSCGPMISGHIARNWKRHGRFWSCSTF